MNYNIHENFSKIYDVLLKTKKRTAIAHKIGYSSTAQLSRTLSGEAQFSAKAITNLIMNFDINPIFLFTGKGKMFLSQRQAPVQKFEYFYNSTI